MRLKLETFVYYTDLGRRFRFAVLDLDRSLDYPANFVCLLPTKIYNEGKVNNGFFKIFGDKSLEQAKLLLTKALKSEDDPEVKAEIKRRLTLLEPKQECKIKCSACGKLFQPQHARRFKNNFCEKCRKKKFRSDGDASATT
jgi:hypothetical protein